MILGGISALNDHLVDAIVVQVAGEALEALLAGQLLASGGDGVAHPADHQQVDLSQVADDLVPTPAGLPVPVDVGLAGQEKLADVVSGVVVAARDHHRGADDVVEPTRPRPALLIVVGDVDAVKYPVSVNTSLIQQG